MSKNGHLYALSWCLMVFLGGTQTHTQNKASAPSQWHPYGVRDCISCILVIWWQLSWTDQLAGLQVLLMAIPLKHDLKKHSIIPPHPQHYTAACSNLFMQMSECLKTLFGGAPSSFAVWLEISTCAPWLDFFFYSFYLLCLSTSFCSLLFKNCLKKKKMLKTTNNYCLPPKVVVVVGGGGGGESELRTNN